LSLAAGRPLDPRWGVLARIVDEFITSLGSGACGAHVEAALERLTLLLDDDSSQQM